ncbi:hypothetical protein [Achromobacter animicus]|uniref:hypothetical protein n=1 Tax=Achromobacter animicus TaxID=1389935 RepID=UPI0015822DA8|nr:hypothetical protein [Achromobacter animicus]
MSVFSRSIARFANACIKRLPSKPRPPGGHGDIRRDPRSTPGCDPGCDPYPIHAAISSPWRIYRIYARPGHLLLRNEQGHILNLGVMKGAEPNLRYRLFARDLQGRGFATRTQLLDDIARRIEAGEVNQELRTLPAWDRPLGADLDRGSHTDVSTKLSR